MKNAPSPLASLKSRPFVSSPLASGDFFASASPRNVERSPTDHSRPRSRFFRERNSHLQRYRDFQPDLSTNEKDKSPGFLALQTLSRIETSFIEKTKASGFPFSNSFSKEKKEASTSSNCPVILLSFALKELYDSTYVNRIIVLSCKLILSYSIGYLSLFLFLPSIFDSILNDFSQFQSFSRPLDVILLRDPSRFSRGKQHEGWNRSSDPKGMHVAPADPRSVAVERA